jgi:hypothetical protein
MLPPKPSNYFSMLLHTLLNVSLFTVSVVAFSALALVVAAGVMFYAYIKMEEHSKRMAKYINMTKFNQIEISHHSIRLDRLEDTLNMKPDSITQGDEKRESFLRPLSAQASPKTS